MMEKEKEVIVCWRGDLRG